MDGNLVIYVDVLSLKVRRSINRDVCVCVETGGVHIWLRQELKKSQCLSVRHGHKLSRALNSSSFSLGRSQVSL